MNERDFQAAGLQQQVAGQLGGLGATAREKPQTVFQATQETLGFAHKLTMENIQMVITMHEKMFGHSPSTPDIGQDRPQPSGTVHDIQRNADEVRDAANALNSILHELTNQV